MLLSRNLTRSGHCRRRSGLLLLTRFSFGNLFGRYATEIVSKTELVQTPDDPLGGVIVPALHAIAVVVLKLVMIVVIPLTEGDQRHEAAIAGGATAGVGLPADGMAERIDAEGRMLHGDHTRHTANQETAQCANPAIPQKTESGREGKAHESGNQVNVPMLPHNEPILFQVEHVVEWRRRIELEEQPPDVRPEEALGNVVGIIVVIDVLVVAAMLGSPKQGGIFKRCSAKKESRQTHAPVRRKCLMRKQAMIPEGDAHGRGREHEEKQADLEPIDAKLPDVEWDGSERQKKGAEEEGTGWPVDAFEGYAVHRVGR